MLSQEAVQGGNTIPVVITIPGNATTGPNRKSFLQLIAASTVPKLTQVQLDNIIGGVITARAPASGTPPSAAPAARTDFCFGFTDGTGTGQTPTQIAGCADANLTDYAGVGEELDLKGVEWLRTAVPLSLVAGTVSAIVRVYLRQN